MLFDSRPTRTAQNVQPTAVAFAAFTATHPQLPFETARMRAGTVTVHLHGPYALVHLAHWEGALGNCARSNDSFPSSHDSHLYYTECRTAVAAGTAFEVVAFHDGPGAYDPHHMVRPAMAPIQFALSTDTALSSARPNSPSYRCALVLGITAALAVTAVITAAVSQRVTAARPHHIPTDS